MENSFHVSVDIPNRLVPGFLAALDLAVAELRKQYGKAEDDRLHLLPENVGHLVSIRNWIAEALAKAEKAA